jgi:fatty-acyl-CoA synthase
MATDTGPRRPRRSAAALDTQVRQFIWLPSEEPTQPVAGMTPFDALAERATRCRWWT